MDEEGRPPHGRFEILGAWLRVWTPPRDAVVPPVPKAKIALGAGAVALVAGGTIALIEPVIEHGKQTRAERERAALAKREAEKRRRLRREGRPMTARVRRPAGGDTVAARHELVTAVERSITRDARTRARRGELEGPVLGTRCAIEPPSQRAIERELHVASAEYECLAITHRDPVGQLDVGDSFEANVRYRDFSYAWRKVCLPPGEGSARLQC
jgi:hypothetical protein